MKIDIEGLNKVKLVKALYDFAKPTEKTDAYREITLEDIAYFVNKDRKINVINGKNIKCDIGRYKLSSGVYDKFNGEFAAINAVEALKSQYAQIEFVAGTSLSECINELSNKNTLCYGIFNGHPIYSDNLNRDEIFIRICGMTEQDLESRKKQAALDYEKQEKEFKKRIPTMAKKYFALAKGVIAEKKKKKWNQVVPIRLNDLYKGMELDATLDIIKELNKADENNNHFAEAKEIFESQGHSGMSWGLMCSMLIEFAPNGVEFVKYCKVLMTLS